MEPCGEEKTGATPSAWTSDATPVYSRAQSLPISQPGRQGTPRAAGRSQGSCDSGLSGPEATSAAWRRRQPAGTEKAYASPSGKHESIAAWRYDPFGEFYRDEVVAARETRRIGRPERVCLVNRNAPGVLGELSVELHGAPPLRLGDVSLGRGKYACVAGKRNIAEEQAEELTQRRQISVKLLSDLRASILTPPARHAYTPAGGVRHF